MNKQSKLGNNVSLVGETFGRLVVIEQAQRPSHVKTAGRFWLCQCSCGNTTIIRTGSLRQGTTVSCGCYNADRMRIEKPALKHGCRIDPSNTPPEYTSWSGMIARCTNPRHHSYANYGGRGIKVCQQWRDSFESFLADVGPRPSARHSIDRVDNDGDYEPGNVHWATPEQQARNRRDVPGIAFAGKTQSLIAWSAETGIDISTLWSRIHVLGWTTEHTLTTKPRIYSRK